MGLLCAQPAEILLIQSSPRWALPALNQSLHSSLRTLNELLHIYTFTKHPLSPEKRVHFDVPLRYPVARPSSVQTVQNPASPQFAGRRRITQQGLCTQTNTLPFHPLPISAQRPSDGAAAGAYQRRPDPNPLFNVHYRLRSYHINGSTFSPTQGLFSSSRIHDSSQSGSPKRHISHTFIAAAIIPS